MAVGKGTQARKAVVRPNWTSNCVIEVPTGGAGKAGGGIKEIPTVAQADRCTRKC